MSKLVICVPTCMLLSGTLGKCFCTYFAMFKITAGRIETRNEKELQREPMRL